MSVQAISWVFDHSPTTGTDRLVLLALANHAASDSWECYPSIALLAREAGIGRPRTVQQSLGRLEADGHIERSINGAIDSRIRADRRPNLYRILHGVTLHAVPSEDGVTLHAERGDASRSNGVTPNDTQTVREPSDQPSFSTKRLKRLTADQRATLLRDFKVLPHLEETIAFALTHDAHAKCTDEYLYLRHWLNRDMERLAHRDTGPLRRSPPVGTNHTREDYAGWDVTFVDTTG